MSLILYCASGLRSSSSSRPCSLMAHESRRDSSLVKMERSMSPSAHQVGRVLNCSPCCRLNEGMVMQEGGTWQVCFERHRSERAGHDFDRCEASGYHAADIVGDAGPSFLAAPRWFNSTDELLRPILEQTRWNLGVFQRSFGV